MSMTAPAGEAIGPDIAAGGQLPRRRVLLLVLLGSGLLVLACVWALRWWMVGRFIETTDDAYLRADNVIIAPKVTGYVAEVLVTDNQTVMAGQPLVRLDDRQYRAALEQATATIAARRADITRGEAELLQRQAEVDRARATLDGARAHEAFVVEQTQRHAPLVAIGAESGERMAELRSGRKQAAADVESNRAALLATQRQVVATQAQIEQAKAQLAVAQASARQAQFDIHDTVIRSASAGRVGDRAVRVGQYVQPGSRLLTLVPVQDLYLEANFKETQIGMMRPGQPARILVDTLGGTELHGTVQSLSPGTGAQFALLPPQNATGNFTKIVQRVPVRIRVEAGKEARSVLVPGLSVTVHVDTRGAQAARERIDQEASRG
ncbi:HlyD family secretion protein [Ralstonia insidiosa]|uniref:Multidrug ABC transporter permease n=2 Tax=Ralstonia insidiosa TaxID=190721 RepID=A0A192A3S1_9RALS|nr:MULTISPECIES: HlyD family secretion protein [Ralstonia]ANJ74932.1 multidrug ABC transporter permease [Ralstonia insidiosa]EPX94644.1 hypothetical protein C404_27830 [Ralstonia sp. AU12-08]KAB0468348.1 HlyD family secretion protein [Ralstonia insidiosa]MBY4911052.1 HlyD family secretion protein [Ralstonia insidiosa]